MNIKLFVYFIIFTWLVAILVFLNHIPFSSSLLLAILVLSHFVLVLYCPETIVYLLVNAMILSPIFGSFQIAGFNILFSDILILYAFVILLILKRNIRHSIDFYILFFVLFFHFIAHFLVGDLVSLKPLVSILEIFIVYFIAKEGFKKVDLNLFLTSATVAVMFGVMLMFLSFYQGVNLNDYEGDSSSLVQNATDFNLENYRIGFFYTNFPFVIASVFFIILYRFKIHKNIFRKLFFLVLAILLCLALIASGNKTTLFATIIILVLTSIIVEQKKLLKLSSLTYLALSIPVIYYILYGFFLNSMNAEQFTGRMLSTDSFRDRLGVYVNSYNIIASIPYRLFTGYGPDFLSGGGQGLIANSFKINFYTKQEQGAVDSGIITFIIEFGILVIFLIANCIFNVLKSLSRRFSNINVLLIQVVLVFIISGTTQVIGLSKMFWFFVMIFALARSRILSEDQTSLNPVSS